MMTAAVESTKPAAGVITTSPPTTPEQKPRTVGLPRDNHATSGQENPATAAAKVVVVKALAEMPSAATALPALNPYQPTQSMPVPIIVSTKLCGAKFSCPNPLRLPTINASTSADQPDDM